MSGPAPLVSIGLPVYNGEAYLERALHSLMAQDFRDFELIICDNASTDGTAAIARRWADRDPRIRYCASPSNIGLERNFARTLQLARGRYFRWAACDDLVEPDHLRRCLAALQAAPDAVLCQSFVRVVDAAGREIGIYDGGLLGAESREVSERFAALALSRHLCTHIFGIMRTETLRRTRPLAPYYGSDRVALAELALLGRFVHVPAPLFVNREHPARGSRAGRRLGRRKGPPIWNLYVDYWRAVAIHVREPWARLACRLHLLRWWAKDWNLARLLVEILGGIYPPVHHWAYRLKLRFYGPLPQVRSRTQT